ncbi:MBL fold metallo-hydrolase RNA specificity domain-containing protein [Pseudolysinimonas yzui]|uniref:MBL fold hydrolase n=1 Tax=Pseudolysinimonas yzui TaxID=2708254 RepID=A0A8J3LZ18_9MICO|nr:MBL fold metallo-hydrolase [Pseudolysinimonas yzui]GHF08551.1 MBL fold hydrolase [Pseudolysinimonas yzui]
MDAPRITFLGAADTVTGSRYLVETDEVRILVDCGLFQGYKVLRERNREPFPVRPASIDAVVLTHAHLDHTGYLPALVRDGFDGRIYATPGTVALCGVLLPDSGRLLEEEAGWAREKRFSRHKSPTPLYTEVDANVALRSFHAQPFDTPFEPAGGVTARFSAAGHITGAAQVTLEAGGVSFHFSGDLGRPSDPLMRAPEPPPAVDVLVVESTYGDRAHPQSDPEAELGAVIRRVVGRGGVVIIPAFAVGRAESILFHLSRLRDRGEIPEVPVYLNSPMALEATAIARTHPEEHRHSAEEAERMATLAIPVRTVDESIALNRRSGPMIIVSASGMLSGGRVLHHVVRFGPDSRNAIVLSGYQAGGTRGADLAAGARVLRIFGRDVPIEAEVVDIGTLSAHADADEVLAWLRRAERPPRLTFVTHGEPSAADTLRRRIKHELGWDVRVPEHREEVDVLAAIEGSVGRSG